MSQFNDLLTYPERLKSLEERRAIAVAAALSIIHAKAANTPTNSSIITDEMQNLGTYADQIQEALKLK